MLACCKFLYIQTVLLPCKYLALLFAKIKQSSQCLWRIAITYLIGFWKITHIGVPETITIFEFSMVLLIVQTIFTNISKLYL